jgi:hypothetical protein
MPPLLNQGLSNRARIKQWRIQKHYQCYLPIDMHNTHPAKYSDAFSAPFFKAMLAPKTTAARTLNNKMC